MKITLLSALLVSSLYFSQDRKKIIVTEHDSLSNPKIDLKSLQENKLSESDSLKYYLLVKKPEDSLYLSLVKKTPNADMIKILNADKREKLIVKAEDVKPAGKK